MDANEKNKNPVSLMISSGKEYKNLIFDFANYEFGDEEVEEEKNEIIKILNARKDYKNTIKNLMKINANLQREGLIKATEENLWEAAKILFSIGAGNIVDEQGQTPLMWVAKKGHYNTLLRLIKYGANIHCRDNEGRDALMLSCIKNGTVAIVHCLIKYGAEVNAKDKYGKTALMLAIQYGNDFVIDELVKKAKINLRDKEGKTAIILANEKGYSNISYMLKEYGAIDPNNGWKNALAHLGENKHEQFITRMNLKIRTGVHLKNCKKHLRRDGGKETSREKHIRRESSKKDFMEYIEELKRNKEKHIRRESSKATIYKFKKKDFLEYIDGLKQKKVLGEKRYTEDNHEYYEFTKSCYYKGIEFKKGEYLSSDKLHREWEWFGENRLHKGPINPKNWNVISRKLVSDRILSIPLKS